MLRKRWRLFKNDEKQFEVQLKSSSPSYKVFKFVYWLFGHLGKRLDKKAKINFKTYTSKIGKQIITIHILPKVWRSKSN